MNLLKKGLAVLSAITLLMSGGMMLLSDSDVITGQTIKVYAAETTQVWDGSVDTSWYDSQEAEIHISTAEEFAGLAAIVAGGKSMAGQTIILDNDIYLNVMVDVDSWDTKPPENKWKSIGNETNGFSGTFDGGNHTIYGLYSCGDEEKKGGLFGYIKNGTIQNISLRDAYIVNASSVLCSVNTEGTIENCNVDAIATCYGSYGGICYENNNGTINGCVNSGNIYIDGDGSVGGVCGVSTNAVTNSTNNADISGTYDGIVGGVVGQGGGTNLYNTGNISTKANYCGGIAGRAKCNMENCINDGNISISSIIDNDYRYGKVVACGGIAGYAYYLNSFKSCINNGDITLTSIENNEGFTIYSGGISGYNEYWIDYIECGNNGKIIGFDYSGGITGYIDSSNWMSFDLSFMDSQYNYCYNKGDITGEKGAGGLIGNASPHRGRAIIESSYNIGNITATETSSYSGGFIGYGDYDFNIKNSYSASEKVSGKYAGGILGCLQYEYGTKVENCYYLNVSASQGIGNKNNDIGITKSAVNMKKPIFADNLGSAFIYVENEYPVLFWEKGLDLITLNETSYKFTEYKQQFDLTAETLSSEPIKWTSSNEKVAKVDQNGVVTAIGNGNCSITASIGESKAICKINVNYDYYIEESGFRLDVDKGKTITIFSKNTESPVEGIEVSFTSDNEKVATVNERGIVSANTAGVANIHINIGEIELVCKVVVIGVVGDVNEDGVFSVADVILLQKWLLAVPGTELPNWKAADLCEDDILNVFDLCLMKRALIENT